MDAVHAVLATQNGAEGAAVLAAVHGLQDFQAAVAEDELQSAAGRAAAVFLAAAVLAAAWLHDGYAGPAEHAVPAGPAEPAAV